MTDQPSLEVFLAGARIDSAVTTLRPDHRALLIAVHGIVPVQSDDATEALLARAEAAASDPLADSPAEEVPHVAARHEAYRAFGASRSAPATASKRSCIAPVPVFRGSMGSPTSTTRSASSTRSRWETRISTGRPVRHG